jgi:hypothetical protein
MSAAGQALVFGIPRPGVEVLAVVGSKVVSATTTDADGRYVLADARPEQVVARFYDRFDLKLTPRVEVPPVVVLHEADGLREAYWSRRFVQSTFEVRVLRGTWEVRAGREIDGPLSVSPQPNLLIDALVLEDGTRPPPRFGGFEASITHDTSLTVQLRAA